MNYLVLIADIVSSRQILQREQTQEDLRSVLQELSRTNPNLVSPYTITLGDEFQAVFNRADNVFSDAMEILSALYPVKIRFSFGVGSILTQINHEQALGMDGPAFYHARTGIEQLKDTNYLFSIAGIDKPDSTLIQESLHLVSYSFSSWNRTRLHTFRSLFNQLDIQKIAAELHVSDKAIYKTISEGNLQNIFRLLNEITAMINKELI